jgi:hypothetical protein
MKINRENISKNRVFLSKNREIWVSVHCLHDLRPSSSLSGRNSTYRPVQICEASSLLGGLACQIRASKHHNIYAQLGIADRAKKCPIPAGVDIGQLCIGRNSGGEPVPFRASGKFDPRALRRSGVSGMQNVRPSVAKAGRIIPLAMLRGLHHDTPEYDLR